MLKKVTCLKYHGGTFVETEHEVVKEEPLAISINGRHYVTAMISPKMKKEFVIGHLFSEGVINDIKEIESLQLVETTANVLITHPLKVVAARKIMTGTRTANSTNNSKTNPINSTIGRHAIFLPSRTRCLGTGSKTSIRNPLRSGPNKLNIIWVIPKNVTATAPVATKGLKVSLRSAERRKRTAPPQTSIIKRFVANIIFISGALFMER